MLCANQPRMKEPSQSFAFFRKGRTTAKHCFWTCSVLLLLLSNPGAAQSAPAAGAASSIYHTGWIDLNKNGRMDVYEDPHASIDARVDDLLSQMTADEKTCQLATLYGYKRVLKDILPTPEWKTRIWKDGIANIDEHLNGWIGVGKPLSDSIYATNIRKHVWAMNEVQRFFIEQTRLGIPADFTNEGIRGVEAYTATSFPTPIGMGSTWDRTLLHQMGRITAVEGRALGYTNVYAPVLDVARDQRWGRMEEVYGEDPYLVSRLGVEMVRGMQENYTVAATAKHFAAYSANKGAREGSARTDPQVPRREVENLMLPPFRAAIREAGLLGVMSSYNDYDGIPISGSSYWLTDRLRKDFGFRGYVVSDSGAVEDLFAKHGVAANPDDAVREAFDAGVNVRTNFTPPEDYILPLRRLLQDGRISTSTLNERVRDVLRVKFTVGIFDHPYVENPDRSVKLVNSPEHQKVALQASRESIVLLKNEHQALPLQKSIQSIAVIGPNADSSDFVHAQYGPLGVKAVTVLDGIRAKLGEKVAIRYVKGCEITDPRWPESEILPEPLSGEEQAQIQSAVEAAQKSDVAVVVLGESLRTAGESRSRTSLDLPGRQLDLIKAVEQTGKPVIVVLIGPRPLSINWIDKYVPGIIEAWYPGAQGGTAIADVLFGDYNPGGKLTVTFPKTVGQIPFNFPTKPKAQWEGESSRVNGALYNFGYGLSYTTFAYSDLAITPARQRQGGEIEVSFKLTNTGTRAGDDVPQLYTRQVLSSVTTYEKNLRGFERVSLRPGESRVVSFKLKPEDLAIWNREMQFGVEPGVYRVMVGASSTDIRLRGEFNVLPAQKD